MCIVTIYPPRKIIVVAEFVVSLIRFFRFLLLLLLLVLLSFNMHISHHFYRSCCCCFVGSLYVNRLSHSHYVVASNRRRIICTFIYNRKVHIIISGLFFNPVSRNTSRVKYVADANGYRERERKRILFLTKKE